MRNLILLVALIFLFAGSAYADYEYSKMMELEPGEDNLLTIDCEIVDLDVIGHENTETIKVKIEIFANRFKSDEAQKIIAENFEIALRNNGNESELICNYTGSKSKMRKLFDGRSEDLEIVLLVEVPSGIDLTIEGDYNEIYLKDIDGDIDFDCDYKRLISKGCEEYESDDYGFLEELDLRFESLFDKFEVLEELEDLEDLEELDILLNLSRKNHKRVRHYDHGYDYDDYDDDVYYTYDGSTVTIHGMDHFVLPELPALPEFPDFPELPELPELRGLEALQSLESLEALDDLELLFDEDNHYRVRKCE